MKLYIPEIGDQIKLTEDWSFSISNEYRNSDFLKILYTYQPTLESSMERDKARYARDLEEWRKESARQYQQNRFAYTWNDSFDGPDPQISFTLPARTVLKIDRIYIRKGAEDYSSITFFLTDCPIPELAPHDKKKNPKGIKGGKRRFWVKLRDANNIWFEHV